VAEMAMEGAVVDGEGLQTIQGEEPVEVAKRWRWCMMRIHCGKEKEHKPFPLGFSKCSWIPVSKSSCTAWAVLLRHMINS
jgi:hypothetical protein